MDLAVNLRARKLSNMVGPRAYPVLYDTKPGLKFRRQALQLRGRVLTIVRVN